MSNLKRPDPDTSPNGMLTEDSRNIDSFRSSSAHLGLVQLVHHVGPNPNLAPECVLGYPCVKGRNLMKRISVILMGMMAFVSVGILHQANAQTTPETSTTTATAMTITCTVSADEKRIVNDKDEKSWTVANPKSLKGHAGDHVTITAQVNASKNQITVKSVRVLEASATNTPNTVKDNDDKLRTPPLSRE
jgi:hypothetical protein